MRFFDVPFAIAMILLGSCGLLQQLVANWGESLTDSSLKLAIFGWTVFTIALIGLVSSGISISFLH